MRNEPLPLPAPVAAGLDLVGVVAFAAVGRSSHGEAAGVSGTADTAWPFVAGLAAGWVASRAWRRPTLVVPTGVAVWGGALVGGMGLRALTGSGTAVPFVVVAGVVLGALLLGWRGLLRFGGRR
ncbi:MAG: DUF3054 domain-containing protein [Actinomycetes bacterium]